MNKFLWRCSAKIPEILAQFVDIDTLGILLRAFFKVPPTTYLHIYLYIIMPRPNAAKA